jgi:23S rRNA pseudouridine955/2504/2580 synthase
MALIKHPIIGDEKYMAGEHGLIDAVEGKLHLHARRLVIPHPITGETLDVTAPLPAHMAATWELLGFDPEKFGEGSA